MSEKIKIIIDRNNKGVVLGRDPSFNDLSKDLKISDAEKRGIKNITMGDLLDLYNEIKKG